jgi:hypothetical protein
MKYCLKWNNRCYHLKDADEISIKYIEDKGLLDFLEKYANKRIILRIIAKDFIDSELAKLVAIKRQFPDYQFTVALDEYHPQLIEKMKEKELPFYILQPVKNWEVLNHYVKDLKVSDVDLSGALGFELPKVKRFLEKFGPNIKVRVTPNIITSDSLHCPPLQMFFIRPDDLDQYEPYVDVVEFEGLEHQDTFFNIYAKEKTFVGKLNQVIYNFPLSVDNLGLISSFGERRIGCGRECLYGGRCRRCDNLVDLSQEMGTRARTKIIENIKEKIEKNELN